MAKRFVLILTMFFLFNPIMGNESFDSQKNKRETTLKDIDNNKIIINKRKFFEDLPWGTKIENVKKAEDRVLLNETKNELDYEVKIDSLTAILVYGFKEQRLDSVMLLLREEDNFDVYNVEYSDILFNLVSEMELFLGKAVYTDTLREKHIKRYPTKNPETINSINFIWNFTNTKVTATKTNIPGLPILITYKAKEYENIIDKKPLNLKKEKNHLSKYKGLLGVGIIFLLVLRVFSRLMRARTKIKAVKKDQTNNKEE